MPNNPQADEVKSLVAELTREVVTESAPEELDLFDDMMQDYFADPNPPEAGKNRDDALGFGLGEVLSAATPAAAAMVSAVLSYILTEVIKTTQEETANALKEKIKALFKKPEQGAPASAPATAPLTREQLDMVQKIAKQQAAKFGLEPGEAEKMSDALVGVLARK